MEMEMAEQISVDKCLLDLQRQWGAECMLILFPHHTWLIFLAEISGNSSLLGTDALS